MTSELEMLGFLKTNGTSCRFVSLLTKTPVVKIRVANPWGAGAKSKSGLWKVSRKLGIINVNYNTSVRRRIAEKFNMNMEQAEYENGETWYEHLTTGDGKPLPVVVHKEHQDKYYLQFFTHKAHSVYVNEAGETVSDEIVKPWLYAESEKPDFKPTVIVVGLANIKELRASGLIIEMPEMEEAETILLQGQ